MHPIFKCLSSAAFARLLLVALLAVLYCMTEARTVTMEDSAEFLMTAFFGGIPHPPGYPLFVLIGQCLSSLLSILDPVIVIGMISVFSSVLSSLLVFEILLLFGRDVFISLVCALIYGFSFPVWSQAVVTEVYALNAALTALTFFFAVRFYKKNKAKDFYCCSLFAGFAICNHWPLFVLTVPGLALILVPKVNQLRFKQFFLSSICFLVGLLPYCYLFVAHYFSDFLFIGPITNLSVFSDYFLRKEYSSLNITPYAGLSDYLNFVLYFLDLVFKEFGPLGVLAITLGILGCGGLIASFAPLVLVSVIASSSMILTLAWRPEFYDLTRELYLSFQTISFLGCAVAFGFGLIFIKNQLQRIKHAFVVVLMVAFAFCLSNAFRNYKDVDLSNDRLGEDYARTILESLPTNSVLLVKNDADAGSIAFMHWVKGLRPDITVTSQVAALLPEKIFHRNVDIPLGRHQVKLLNFIENAHSERRCVYTTRTLTYFDSNSNFPMQYSQYGLFFGIEPIDSVEKNCMPSSEIADKSRAILDQELSGAYSNQFAHYRSINIAGICHLMLLKNMDHPIFTQHRGCLLVLAQWTSAMLQKYFDADRLFLRYMHQSEGFDPLYERVNVKLQFFNNRIKAAESLNDNPHKVVEMLRDAVDQIKADALKYNVCENKLVIKMIQVSASLGIPFDINELRRIFGDCREHMDILNAYVKTMESKEGKLR